MRAGDLLLRLLARALEMESPGVVGPTSGVLRVEAAPGAAREPTPCPERPIGPSVSRSIESSPSTGSASSNSDEYESLLGS